MADGGRAWVNDVPRFGSPKIHSPPKQRNSHKPNEMTSAFGTVVKDVVKDTDDQGRVRGKLEYCFFQLCIKRIHP